MTKEEALLRFIPLTKEELFARGWDELDILFVTGDAYIDHPSFGIPLLARFLESKGYRVGIISQPQTIDDYKRLGKPKLFVGIGTGVVDSMLNNYTADKKKRSDDEYAPGAQGGLRPDYAATVYAENIRKIFPDVFIIGGGVEVSLRRFSHYDYWQNKVMPSILITAPYDLVIYGMAEKKLLHIAAEIKRTGDARLVFGNLSLERGLAYVTEKEKTKKIEHRLVIPSHEEVKEDKKKFLKATTLVLGEVNPYNAKTIVQYYRDRAIVANPPEFPLSEEELDEVYDLPFTKEQHWIYKKKIPALDMIKNSITSNRGCFGGCSFCSITLHQGKIVQSRSRDSIIREVKRLFADPEFKGIISDIGGPTANMYKMFCTNKEAQKVCKKTSCLYPDVCNNLKTDHCEQIDLLRAVSAIDGIRRVFIASGVRYDLALKDKKYLKELIGKHVSGQLKVAPEHKDKSVLDLMRKPSFEVFLKFRDVFRQVSKEFGKEQYLVPYFISSFPGATKSKMKDLEDWLKKENWKLQQVQNYIPLPMTLASAIYYSEIHPDTKEHLFVAKTQENRAQQKQSLQLKKHRYQKRRT